jgi:hypothetical protein
MRELYICRSKCKVIELTLHFNKLPFAPNVSLVNGLICDRMNGPSQALGSKRLKLGSNFFWQRESFS